MADETRASQALGSIDAHADGQVGAPPLHRLPLSLINACALLLVVGSISWVLAVPRYLGLTFFTEQSLAAALGLGLCICFLALSFRGERQSGLPVLDMILGVVGLAACWWIAWQYPRLLYDVPNRTPEILVLSAIVLVLCLEGLRRATGWALLLVVLFFFLYAMAAHLAPEALRGRTLQPAQLGVYLVFDSSALLGMPLVIGLTIVLMYLWMGEALIRSGGGEFFKDISVAMLGAKRGGPAKICVMGSALFGTISGSAVSSVASVGIFTIPLMKRTGYSAKEAGAIEAVSSTGGQLMPPVMGAAAFLMAEFIERPYAQVAMAAAIPAVLYYLALYWQVDLIAGKQSHQRLTGEIPRVGGVLREGWHLIVPFPVLLLGIFVLQHSPEVAALGATVALFVVNLFRSYKGKRLRFVDFPATLISAGRTMTDLIVTLAAAGFVIGILSVTGLGFALTVWLVEIAGANLYVLLLIAFLLSLILGMGMPTAAVYVLLATMVAPSIIEGLGKFMGESGASPDALKMAAHMFILYGGMLSMITPPVALAVYAAANISGSGPMETGWWAVRIGWAKFALPFLFVLSPTLLLFGDPLWIVLDCATAVIGIYLVTAGIVGWYERPMTLIERIAVLVAGILAILPANVLSIIVKGDTTALGSVIGLLLLFYLAGTPKQAAAGAADGWRATGDRPLTPRRRPDR
jgi:TRAP transporter 4TM/12TM fusion protein